MTVVYPEAFRRVLRESRKPELATEARDLALLRLVMRKVRSGSMRLRGISFHSTRGTVDRAIIEVVSSEEKK